MAARALQRAARRSSPPKARLSRGLEVHPHASGDDLELWLDPAYVRAGYSWSFPARDELRVGVGSFEPRDRVKEPTVRLANDLDVPAVRYQGNWIPHQMRAPVEDGIFFVGDSAGHCLPTTAEGIRTALYFGLACGRELRLVLDGRQAREQALTRYADFCEEHRWAFTWLLRVQRWVGRLNPYPAMTSALEAMDRQSFIDWSFGHYLEIAPPGLRRAGPPEGLKNGGAPAEHLGVVLRSLPSLLLRPAIAGLNRLRLSRKLVVIALVLIAPALYATWQFRSQQDAQIAFSAKERVGIDEIVPAQRLLADLATAQSLAVRAAGRDAEATTTLPAAQAAVSALGRRDGRGRRAPGLAARDPRDVEAPARVDQARASSPRPIGATRTLAAYDRLTAATLALIVQAGNQSNLILDPDLDSYYAMDALVNKAPLALATAGRVSSREIAMVASGHSTEAERIALAVDQGVLAGAVDAIATGFKTAYANTSDADAAHRARPCPRAALGHHRVADARAHARGAPRPRRDRRDDLRQGRGRRRRRAAGAARPRARPAARRPRRPPARDRPPRLRRAGPRRSRSPRTSSSPSSSP